MSAHAEAFDSFVTQLAEELAQVYSPNASVEVRWQENGVLEIPCKDDNCTDPAHFLNLFQMDLTAIYVEVEDAYVVVPISNGLLRKYGADAILEESFNRIIEALGILFKQRALLPVPPPEEW